MFKYIVAIGLLLFTASKASATLIYADDFAVGENVTHLTENATLSWLAGTGSSTPSYVSGPENFYHQHFGGANSATTYDTFPGIWNEAHGSPNPQNYAALEINFATAIRSFGLKVENHTSSPFLVYLFGADGGFLQALSVDVKNTGVRPPETPEMGWIFDATYNWNFDFDVSQIKIGGASDAGYIYALDVTQVPEPSSMILLLIGLASVVKMRHSAKAE